MNTSRKEKINMDYSTKISERMWNLPDKGELESEREQTFIDDIVQKAHIERELLSHLDGIQTVFDGGAGCGRFSILLEGRCPRPHHLCQRCPGRSLCLYRPEF